ncbi:DUF4870 domain-containing protein [Paramicrobacterium chengjingii]|uniref:DUF4870 domain-containing protein n=1 Tax=Paramicrobacterium chengjingii TaxID=2769067 RepID=A0ABX6YDZ4_9MICO|nr:DUF4870 domain-containing protein [Microbacterium chengjingii]QPZ36997.1 DUF4870 domain-containing protein [Microbacterium chengjingii]
MTDPNAPQPADPNQPPNTQGQPSQTPPQQPQYGQQQAPQYGQQAPQHGQEQPPQPGQQQYGQQQPYAQQPPPQGQQPYGQQPYGQQGQQPYGQPQYAQAPGAQPLSPQDDKMWAMWSHFGGVLSILPSLIIYLVFKDRGPFVRQEAKEALNWQITILIVIIAWSIVVGILSGIVVASMIAGGSFGAISGFTALFSFLSWLPYLLNLIFSIIGGVKVKGGQPYRYPVNFRFIK